jgi:hypothetical protein
MGTYSKRRLLRASVSHIPQIAEAIKRDFELDGFEVKVEEIYGGGRDISVTKGDSFKAVLGMRSALKIALRPQVDGVLFDANVGIFGQQAIPTVISMFFFWPVLITQIWGMVQQSKLDDRALEVAERAIMSSNFTANNVYAQPEAPSGGSEGASFCMNCGAKLVSGAKFCPQCGTKL